LIASHAVSRRAALETLGGALLAGALGPAPGTSARAADAPANRIPVVDTHFHLVSSRLSRLSGDRPPPPPFDLLDQPGGPERLTRMVEAELQAAGVEHALCMPSAEISDDDPLGIGPTLKQAALVRGAKLHPVGLAHPERFDRDHLDRVEQVLKQGRVKALKAYLGYLHYPPTSIGYRPYFRLAARYRVPVIFHTGDTYSPRAKVKYAHPLAVDELAVDFPETTFVLAHFGNPWIMDAAEVVYKNKNVWAELSAFLIGEARDFERMDREGVLERTANRVREAIEFTETPERIMFGSDWPLAPVAAYRDLVMRMVPEKHHRAVLGENAKRLYGLT